MTAVVADHLRPLARVREPRAPLGRSIADLKQLVGSGAVALPELIDAHLERLDEVNAVLNFVVTARGDDARADAARLQRRVGHDSKSLPLLGMPFTVKDVIATADLPTACGSLAFADNRPTVDAVVVARLRRAGAILLAKTNCPEFAFGVTTENELVGRTSNPWGDFSPGGSSGGEAVAVAAGVVPFGVGTDYGGSLRWPAQNCGVLALRPGVGRVEGAGQLPGEGGRMDGRGAWRIRGAGGSVQQAFQVIGPVARSVADLALVAGVIAGAPKLVDLATGMREHRPLRIAWSTTENDGSVGSGVVGALREFVGRLEGLGHELVEMPQILTGLHEAFNDLRATDPMNDLRTALAARPDLVSEATARLLSAPPAASDNEAQWVVIERLQQRVAEDLAGFDALLVPVAPAPACDYEATAVVDGTRLSGFELMAQCRAVSALGFPALSIPIGYVDDLPVSVQVVTRPGLDDRCLEVGMALEAAGAGARTPPWSTSDLFPPSKNKEPR